MQSIIDEVYIPLNLKERSAPASASRLLTRELDAPKFDERFHYRQVIGNTNYLEKGSRGDISFATHQCA
eukprot:2163133-Ditylum_brightwellii.AAC.1